MKVGDLVRAKSGRLLFGVRTIDAMEDSAWEVPVVAVEGSMIMVRLYNGNYMIAQKSKAVVSRRA